VSVVWDGLFSEESRYGHGVERREVFWLTGNVVAGLWVVSRVRELLGIVHGWREEGWWAVDGYFIGWEANLSG